MYLIRCWKDDETFYKIGRTFQGLKTRFSGKSSIPYSYESIYEYSCDAGCIWDSEKDYHRKYKEYQYFPNERFAGYTECFNLDLPISEIIDDLQQK